VTGHINAWAVGGLQGMNLFASNSRYTWLSKLRPEDPYCFIEVDQNGWLQRIFGAQGSGRSGMSADHQYLALHRRSCNVSFLIGTFRVCALLAVEIAYCRVRIVGL